jgi:NAD(P)H-dependent FMN reductase
MLKIGIIVGSTRPGRKAAAVAKWVHDILKSRKDAEFEIVDIEDYKLPLLDEPVPPTMHQYRNAHTKTWSEKIARSTPTFSSPPNTTMPPRRR